MSKAPTDERVLQAACRGDRDAFPLLVEQFAGELFGFLRRRAGDGDAPDLLQDTFLRIHKVRAVMCLMRLVAASVIAIIVLLASALPAFAQN